MNQPSTSTGKAIDAASADAAVAWFAQLAAGGVAVPDGLEAAAQESQDPRLAKGLRNLAARLRRGAAPEGVSLSELECFIAAQAAQRSSDRGFSEMLSDLATGAQATHQLRRGVAMAAIYPTILLLLSFCVAAIVGKLVSPSLQALLGDFQFEVFVEVTAMLWWHEHVWIFFLVLALCFVTCVVGIALLGPRWLWEGVSRRVPVIGAGLTWLDAAETCRGVEQLLSCGLEYSDALRIARSSTSSPQFRDWLSFAADTIDRGGKLDDTAGYLPRAAIVLPTMIGVVDPAQQDPSRGWNVTSRYFRHCAVARLRLAQVAMPVVAYLLVFLVGLSVIYGMLTPLSLVMNSISSLGGIY